MVLLFIIRTINTTEYKDRSRRTLVYKWLIKLQGNPLAPLWVVLENLDKRWTKYVTRRFG